MKMEDYVVLRDKKNEIIELLNLISNRMSVSLANGEMRLYETDEIYDYIEYLITKIEEILNTNTPEDIQYILGGEFDGELEREPNQNHLWQGMPLYFKIDIMLYTIESKYLLNENKPQRKERIIQILPKLREVRNKVAQLKYNSDFKPDEEYNRYAMENIALSRGNYSFEKQTKENIEFTSVSTISTHENYVWRGGEVRDYSVSHSRESGVPLYKSDQEKIDKAYFNRRKEAYEKMNEIAGKYFEGGEVPFTNDFYSSLKNPEMDERLRSALFGISCELDDNRFNLYDGALLALPRLEKILRIEQQLEKERIEKEQQERQNSINSARERYNAKNFFWKFVHKKINPERINFEEMSNEEIDSLYIGKVK